MSAESTLSIRTIVSAPEIPTSVYETSCLVQPNERVNKINIINILTGHLALLTEELNALKESK